MRSLDVAYMFAGTLISRLELAKNIAEPLWPNLLRKELADAPITLVLAVAAIIFATVQFFDSLYLKGRIRGVLSNEEAVLARIAGLVQKTEDVGRSLSSRYVGTFPKNLKQINEVVQRAGRFSMILTDWVGYAMYSAHQDYEEYKRHLRDLRLLDNPVPVYILAYSHKCATEQFTDQFPPGALRKNGTARGSPNSSSVIDTESQLRKTTKHFWPKCSASSK